MILYCSDFWINFWSNLAAGIIIGGLLFIIFTNLPEKRNAKKNLRIGLEFFLEECELNEKKLQSLDKEFPLMESQTYDNPQILLAQNAWMLLSNMNLLSRINNPKLVRNIFQLEDQVYETNRVLRDVFDFVYRNPGQNKGDSPFIKRASQPCSDADKFLQKTKPYLIQEIEKLKKKDLLDKAEEIISRRN
jgi:hypothetical protein